MRSEALALRSFAATLVLLLLYASNVAGMPYSLTDTLGDSNIVYALARVIEVRNVGPQGQTNEYTGPLAPVWTRLQILEVLKGSVTNKTAWVYPTTAEGSPAGTDKPELRVLRGRELIVILTKSSMLPEMADFYPPGASSWEFTGLSHILSPAEREDRLQSFRGFLAALNEPPGQARIEALRKLLDCPGDGVAFMARRFFKDELLRDPRTQKEKPGMAERLLTSNDRDFRTVALRSRAWPWKILADASRDTDPVILSLLAERLQGRKEREAIALRSSLLRHTNVTVRAAAVSSYRWDLNALGRQILADAFDDSEPAVRAAACEASDQSIARSLGDELKPKLMQLARDKNESVRIAAIRALRHYRENMPVDLFVQTLREPDLGTDVARAVLASLRCEYVLDWSQLQPPLDANVELFVRYARSEDRSLFYPAMSILAKSKLPNAQQLLQEAAKQNPSIEANEWAALLIEGRNGRRLFLPFYH